MKQIKTSFLEDERPTLIPKLQPRKILVHEKFKMYYLQILM